jgi:hypothetical protein
MTDTDTTTVAAPGDASRAEPGPERSPVEGPAPGQRSTAGDLARPGTARPQARPITLEDAQARLRQAYGRQRELQELRAQQAEQTAPVGPGEPQRGASGAPADPTPSGPQTAPQRGPDGRFLPRDGQALDGAPPPAVQEAQTPAPTAPAPPQGSPGRAPARPPREGARPEPTGRAAAPDAPASPAQAVPAEPPAPQEAPPPEAPAEPEAFRSEEWQRAFQAQPGLRRAVRGIQGDPNLSPTQKAERLSSKLTDALRVADAEAQRAQQMAWLRDNRPDDFIAQLRADEAAQETQRQLELRISHMIAEAYEIDPNDPEYLEAGARDGEDYATGLERFVDFTASKSPKFTKRLEAALAAQAKAHQSEVEALRAQHKVDLEAARERGRAEGRSPFGRGSLPAPRTNGQGVRPVGQDDGPGGGPQVPRRAPDVATYRGAIALGYQQREPT